MHFAAETHVTRSIFDNYHFFETDVLGTQVIANAVLKPSSTSIASSTSRHRRSTARRGRLMDEEAPLMPMSPYASAKAGADRLVYSYFATYSLPAIIVRPFNNFGPRQHLEKAVPRFITSCLLDEPLRVHGDGSAERDWTYVDDTCRALDCWCTATGQGGRRGDQHRLRPEHLARRHGAARGEADGQAGRDLSPTLAIVRARYSATPPMRPRPSACSAGARVSFEEGLDDHRLVHANRPGGRSSCGCGTFRSSPRPASVNCTDG